MLFTAKINGTDIYFLANSKESIKKYGSGSFSYVEDVQPVDNMKPWEIPEGFRLFVVDLDAVIDAARHVYINRIDAPVWPWPRSGSRFHFWQPEGLNEAFEKYSSVYPEYTEDAPLDHGDVVLSKDNAVIVSYRP